MKFALTLDVSPARGLSFLQVAILLRQHRLHPESFLMRQETENRSRYWFLLDVPEPEFASFKDELSDLAELFELQVQEWSGDLPLPREPSASFWT